MVSIDPVTKRIDITRGDVVDIGIKVNNNNGTFYTFKKDDVVRIKVFEAKNCSSVVLKKDVKVEEPTEEVVISLSSKDTKIGKIINNKTDYWYEIELNPDTLPQTIIGYEYDEESKVADPKIFRLLPEGGDEE